MPAASLLQADHGKGAEKENCHSLEEILVPKIHPTRWESKSETTIQGTGILHLPSTTLRLPNLETDRKSGKEDPGLQKENGTENLRHVPTRQDPKRQNKSLSKHK